MGISERTVKMGWGGRRTETEVMHSPMLAAAPVEVMAVKGPGVTPTGQTGWAEICSWPRWLAHMEAGPRVRGRVAVQKVAAYYSPPALEKEFCKCGDAPTPFPMACRAVKSLLRRLQKG